MAIILDTRALAEGDSLPFQNALDLSGIDFLGQRVFARPVEIKGRVEKRAGILTLYGQYCAPLSLTCDRCAKLFERDHSGALEVTLLEEAAQQERDDSVLLENGCCDLTEIFTPAIILSLDSKNLCREDCKGLCPLCGQDLNDKTCDCTTETTDPRLEVLRTLLQPETSE